MVTRAAATTKDFPMNENGQTYGVSMDMLSIEEYPDLIAAIATNGKEGYILKSDLERYYAAAMPNNPEEAIAMMNGYFKQWAEGLDDYVFGKTGVRIDIEAAKAVFRTINDTSGAKSPYVLLSDMEKKALISLLPKDYQNESFAAEALDAAYKATEISIPVYLLDGKTIVGELRAG